VPSIGIGIGLNVRRGGGWSPLALFRTADGVFYEPLDLIRAGGFAGEPVTTLSDKVGSLDATTAGDFVLRRDGALKVSVQRDSGTFAFTSPGFGADCTIAYVDFDGVVILTGQAVGAGSFNLPVTDRLGPYLVIDRALTPGETGQLTGWLARRQPGNWILGIGEWDDNGVWDDGAFWEDAA
jgi:hypothetical protein